MSFEIALKSLLQSLFIGPKGADHKYVRSAVPNQWENVKAVWNNTKATSFGVERLVRLFLGLSAYPFPGLYIRHFSGRHGMMVRKLSLDAYVVFKILVPVVVLWAGWESYRFTQFLAVYLGLETILYIFSLIFLSDIYTAPISFKRSYILVVLNYVELCFDFAVIYKGLGLIKEMQSALDAVYFSFVTSFTIGYGDMAPNTDSGKIWVIIQSLSSLILITLAFSRLVADLEKNNVPSKKV